MTRRLKRALLLTTVAAWSGPAFAENTLPLFIEGQALQSALEELGEQAGLVISAPAGLLNQVQTAPLSGRWTPSDALQELLDGTDLSVRFVEDDSVVITRAAGAGNLLVLDTIFVDGRSDNLAEGGIQEQFETGSSVSTVSREDIEENPGRQSVETSLANQPNINTLGKSNGFIQLRGEDSEGPGNAAFAIIPGALSATPVTVDGRPISFAELTFGFTSVYDTEVVELIRGPSTTRGGLNGSVGAVNIVSAAPTFEQEGEIVTELSSLNGRQLSGFYNMPLSDEVALRFTFDQSERDTYVISPPTAEVIDAASRLKQRAARVSLLWTPADIPELTARLQYNYTDFEGPQTEIVNDPVEELTRTTNLFPAAFLSSSRSLSGSLEYAFENGTVLSNRTTYSENETQRRDASGSFSLDEGGTDVTNETRLNFSALDGRLTGVAGLYYRRQTNEVDWDFFGPTVIDGDRNSLGVYGEVTYELNDQFEVFGGLRYQREDQERVGSLAQTGNPTDIDFERTDDAILPRFGFAYEPNENTRVGFVASRGFNPGGFSYSFPDGAFNDGVTPLDLPVFEDETRNTYEIFARYTSTDGRLSLSTNVFYNDITNAQIVSLIENPVRPGNLIGVITNADKARSYGLEFAADFQATDQLRIFGSLGLIESEFTSFPLSPDIEGNELQEAPDTTLSLGVSYDVTPEFNVGIDVNYTAGYFSNFANDEELAVPSRTITNINASYELREGVEIYSFVTNVFDERSPTFLFGSGASRAGGVSEPRQVGFGARVKF